MKLINREIKYLIFQKRDDGQIRYIKYSRYNGSFEETKHISEATEFEDAKVAMDLSKLLKSQGQLLGDRVYYNYEYPVVEKETNYKTDSELG